LIADLEVSRYDQTAALRMLQKLSSPAEADHPAYAAYPDYDHARQIAWGMILIYSDLDPKPAKDREIIQIFKRLGDVLNLRIHAEPSKRKGETERSFAATLRSAANYDPAWFKEQLEALSRLLPK
jgi:hypothetical protein